MKDCVELAGRWYPGETLTAYTEGGGDPNSILFRIKHPGMGRHPSIPNLTTVGPGGGREIDVVVDEAEVRMLFNWLGAWLHQMQR